MRIIPVGLRGTYATTVKPEHLASQFKDAILPPVLATPIMVLIIENAAPKMTGGEAAMKAVHAAFIG